MPEKRTFIVTKNGKTYKRNSVKYEYKFALYHSTAPRLTGPIDDEGRIYEECVFAWHETYERAVKEVEQLKRVGWIIPIEILSVKEK